MPLDSPTRAELLKMLATVEAELGKGNLDLALEPLLIVIKEDLADLDKQEAITLRTPCNCGPKGSAA